MVKILNTFKATFNCTCFMSKENFIFKSKCLYSKIKINLSKMNLKTTLIELIFARKKSISVKINSYERFFPQKFKNYVFKRRKNGNKFRCFYLELNRES
jgi:hypothetical protein